MKSKYKGCMISALVVILIPFLIFIGLEITEKIPHTVDIQQHIFYKIKLQSVGSPVWPFGPQDGRIVFSNEKKVIEKKKFTLRNDGKGMDKSNWKVFWNEDNVTVIIMGEEQEDETYVFYYSS